MSETKQLIGIFVLGQIIFACMGVWYLWTPFYAYCIWKAKQE